MAQNVVWKYQTPLIGETLATGISGGIRPGLTAPVVASIDQAGVLVINPFSAFLRADNRDNLLMKVDQLTTMMITLGIDSGFVGFKYDWANDPSKEADFEVHPLTEARNYSGIILLVFNRPQRRVYANLADFTDTYWLNYGSGTGLFLRHILPREQGFDYTSFALADYRGLVNNYTLMYQLILTNSTVLKSTLAKTKISFAGRTINKYYLIGYQNKFVSGQAVGIGDLIIIGEGVDSIDAFSSTFNYQLLAIVHWKGETTTSVIYPVLGMVPSGSASAGGNSGSFDLLELPSVGNMDISYYRTHGEPGILTQQRRSALTTPWSDTPWASRYTSDGALVPLVYNDPRLLVTNMSQHDLDLNNALEGRYFGDLIADFDVSKLVYQEWWHWNDSLQSNLQSPSMATLKTWPSNKEIATEVSPAYEIFPAGYAETLDTFNLMVNKATTTAFNKKHSFLIDGWFYVTNTKVEDIYIVEITDGENHFIRLGVFGPQLKYNGVPTFDPDNEVFETIEADQNMLITLDKNTLINVVKSGILLEFTDPLEEGKYVKVDNQSDQLIMVYDKLNSFAIPAGEYSIFTVYNDPTKNYGDVIVIDDLPYNEDTREILYTTAEGAFAGITYFDGPDRVKTVELGADFSFDKWVHFSLVLQEYVHGVLELSHFYSGTNLLYEADITKTVSPTQPTSEIFLPTEKSANQLTINIAPKSLPNIVRLDELYSAIYLDNIDWTLDSYLNPLKLEWASSSMQATDKSLSLFFSGAFRTNIWQELLKETHQEQAFTTDTFDENVRRCLVKYGILHA